MLKDKECNPIDSPEISDVLDSMGVGSFRCGSYWDINPDDSQQGKMLSLNNLYTKSIVGELYNTPLTEIQIQTLMHSLENQNVVCLDLTGNEFNDAALEVILSHLPQTVKTLAIPGDNFKKLNITLLDQFINEHPKCRTITDGLKCVYFQSTDNNNFIVSSYQSDKCETLGNDQTFDHAI